MNINAISQTSQKITQAYMHLCEPLLKKFDLHQVSFDILMFLNNNPDYSTAQEICQIRHIKKNLVSVHVDKLVTSGLLKRSSVAGDRRKISLTCTEKAKPVIESGIEMQARFFAEITAGISDEQRAMLIQLETLLHANAEAIISK